MHRIIIGAALTGAVASGVSAQQPVRPDSVPQVIAIDAPRDRFPDEKSTAKIKKFSFVAYGDTRNSLDGMRVQEVHGLVVESVLAKKASLEKGSDPVRFVVSTGDAVPQGQRADMLNVGFIPLINKLSAAGLAYFFSVGNHDVTGSADLQNPQRVLGLSNALAAHKNLIPPEGSPRRLNGYFTYGFGYGNTFFIGFDSNIADDSTQFRWVKSQLEGLDRKRYVNIVMFCHNPAFSSGPHGGLALERYTDAVRRVYMPLFRKHHVRLVLAGHEHLFEHWIERYRDASGSHRLDEIVSGGGGAPLYWYSAEPDLTEYLTAGAAQHVTVDHLVKPGVDSTSNPHHYLVVHVDGERLSVEVVGVGWGAAFAPYAGGMLIIPPERKQK